MRNAPTRVAMKPRSNFTAPVSPCVYYKMHEGSGLVIADSLGNGPDFTVSAGTPLATNVGNYMPTAPNTTQWASATVADDASSYLANLFDFSTAYDRILIGLDLELGADLASTRYMMSMGLNAATYGQFGLNIQATEAVALLYRGVGASATSSITVAQDQSGVTRSSLLIEVQRTGDNTFAVSGYVNGSVANGGTGTGDWTNNSGTAPLGANGFGDGWAIGGLMPAALGNNKTALLNGGAGENSKIGRFFACRLTSAPAGIAQAVALDLWRDRGEFPRSLAGL